MKKLLLVGALLALGATAFGVQEGRPESGNKTSVNVEVRAEITDDFFVISDIYGKPIVVDFGRIHNTQDQSAVTYVDYKVTSKANMEEPIGFGIALGKSTSANQPDEVTISTKLGGAEVESMKANLVLSEYHGIIEKGEKEYRGRITGTIGKDQIKDRPKGTYIGTTQLAITVD